MQRRLAFGEAPGLFERFDGIRRLAAQEQRDALVKCGMRPVSVSSAKIGHPAGRGNVVAPAKWNNGLNQRGHERIRFPSTEHDRPVWKIQGRRLERKDEQPRRLRSNRKPRCGGQRH